MLIGMCSQDSKYGSTVSAYRARVKCRYQRKQSNSWLRRQKRDEIIVFNFAKEGTAHRKEIMQMEPTLEQYRKSIIDIAVAAWRFQRVFYRAMRRLEAGESYKYMSQYSWFSKRVNSALEGAGLRIVNIEGQIYDPGMDTIPLNMENFLVDEPLYVEQMVEPIIMENEKVVKMGTVILGRVER